MNRFAVKVRFSKIDEENPEKVKRVSETILVDAITHGEAEERVIKEMEQTHKELSVERVSPKFFESVIGGEEGNVVGKWWEITTKHQDPESEKIKTISSKYLVASDDLKSAVILLNDELKQSVLDFELASVSQSQIVEVLEN